MEKGFHRLQRLTKFHRSTEKMNEIRQHIKKRSTNESWKRALAKNTRRNEYYPWRSKIPTGQRQGPGLRFVILLQIMYLRGNSFLSIFLAFYIQHKVSSRVRKSGQQYSQPGNLQACRKSYSKHVFRQMTLCVKQNLSTLWTCRNFTPGISIRKDFQLFSITVQLWFDEWSKWRMAVIAKDKLCGVNVYKGTSPGWCLLTNDEVNFKSLIWWLELKIENVGHSYRRKWRVRQDQKTSTQKRERTEKD